MGGAVSCLHRVYERKENKSNLQVSSAPGCWGRTHGTLHPGFGALQGGGRLALVGLALGWTFWKKRVNSVYPPMTPVTLVSFNQQSVIVPS